MDLTYYYTLFPAYLIGLVIWYLFAKRNELFKGQVDIKFEKPGLEFLFAIIAIVVTILIGQLYTADKLLPTYVAYPFLDAINHFLIFSPFVCLLILRKHGPESAWLPLSNVWKSVGIGLIAALSAILVVALTKGSINNYFNILAETYNLGNFSHLVQVFMEDMAIAICFVRLQAFLGKKWAIILIPVLFAAGHIPALLSMGVGWSGLFSLVCDAGLGLVVILLLSKSKNIWWFWMLHFAMDMMQFVDFFDSTPFN